MFDLSAISDRLAIKVRPMLIACLLAIPLFASAMEKPVVQFSHRLRIETWDNTVSMADTGTSTCYTRQRSSLGLKWAVLPATELGVKLIHEFRYYISPKATPFNKQEVVFDNLYLRWIAPTARPLTLTAGRFNMWFGEGFVVADETPLDGSRTGYFNAIKVDLMIDDSRTITAFYCGMDPQDRALPVINNQRQALADQPEKGLGLYYQQISATAIWHLYYLNWKGEQNSLWSEYNVNTLGFRVERKFTNGWYGVIENALQTNTESFDNLLDSSPDATAFGGFTRIGREFDKPVLSVNKAELGLIYLSGFDPDNWARAGWSPVWGRWPKWSESYIYALIPEGGVAYWSNFTSVYGQATLVPSPESKITLSYHHLGAFYSLPIVGAIYHPLSNPGWGHGKTRGDLFICRYDYKINPRLNGCFIAERFIPGNYYVDGSNSYVWLRSELFYTFDLRM